VVELHHLVGSDFIKDKILEPTDHFEGIILKKIPVKEKDLMLVVLLRCGQKISIYIYGGQGGGKTHRSGQLQLGNLLEFHLQPNKTGLQTDVHSVKNWNVKWAHQKLRHNHLAFYSICFELEVMAKVSLEIPLDLDQDSQQQGMFNVLSNAIYHFDQMLDDRVHLPHQQVVMFMAKLLHHLGIYPEVEFCQFCQCELKNNPPRLNMEGGFICSECAQGQKTEVQDAIVHSLLWRIRHMRFEQFAELHSVDKKTIERMLQYLCFQMQLKPSDFVSLALL
jgi:DNA repair protein RecO